MTTYRLSLPWPHKALSPNARVHWAKRHALTKDARIGAGWAAVAAGLPRIKSDRLDVRITFIPPDKRRRDLDNMIAACKAHCDGIADRAEVDDSKWNVTHVVAEPKAPGSVLFEITEVA